ncbi:MAG: gas vesicle protein GvpJ [Candidatus Bathyarchaeia archaeon]
MVFSKSREATLNSLLDVIMDKGVIIDAAAKIRISDISLLDTKSRIILSSFETAKKLGLKFPANTNLEAQAWQAMSMLQICPKCGRKSTGEEHERECPWCGGIQY